MVVAIILVVAAVSYPVVRGVTRKADRTRCMAKLREIGAGLELYLSEHNDRFPDIAMAADRPAEDLTLEGILRPYVGSPEVFHCPADREEFARSGSSYLWNSTQSGRHKMRTSFFGVENQPELVPLVTDKEAFHGDHNGVNMLYADYHLSNQVEFRVGGR